jgi:hypothetical protein
MRTTILAVIVGLLMASPPGLSADIGTGSSTTAPLQELNEGPTLGAIATVRPYVSLTIFTRARGGPALLQGSYAAPGTPQGDKYGTELSNIRNAGRPGRRGLDVAQIGQGSSLGQVTSSLESDEFMMRYDRFKPYESSRPVGDDDEGRPEMPTNIRFHAAGPGTHDSDQEVVLVVHSNSVAWTIATEATALTGEEGTLPAEHVFVRGPATVLATDAGGGAGFVSLSAPKVVASGTAKGWVQIPVEFRLQTTNDDRVGFYTGQIYVDYFPAP